MMKKKGDVLKPSKSDLMALVAKSAFGAIPFAGPALSELITNLIPNQRIERLYKCIVDLDNRLSKFDPAYIRKSFKDEECMDLFEEGFLQASRAITDERRAYIASIMESGLEADHIAFAESKYILKILQELNDIEIIWLRSYLEPSVRGDKKFREKHKDILRPVPAYLGVDESTLEKAALQDSYKEHLERLGLIRGHYRIDKDTGTPEFEKLSGRPKVTYKDLTPLGRLLLKQIGLLEKGDD